MDLADLYQELILDHSKRPRNFGPLDDCSASCEGYNPLCGDHYTVHVLVRDGNVDEIQFEGTGCAISKAAASTMTEAAKGRTVDAVESLFSVYRNLVTGQTCVLDAPQDLGKLAVFAGVAEFPMRVKCATLAWHAMIGALRGRDSASTE